MLEPMEIGLSHGGRINSAATPLRIHDPQSAKVYACSVIMQFEGNVLIKFKNHGLG